MAQACCVLPDRCVTASRADTTGYCAATSSVTGWFFTAPACIAPSYYAGAQSQTAAGACTTNTSAVINTQPAEVVPFAVNSYRSSLPAFGQFAASALTRRCRGQQKTASAGTWQTRCGTAIQARQRRRLVGLKTSQLVANVLMKTDY